MIRISNKIFKSQIEILEKYAKEKLGYEIIYRDIESCECQYTKKKIIMDNKLNPEFTLYLMLHELGHAKLCNAKISYKKKYEEMYNSFSRGSYTYKITILQEELDAWKEGITISTKLNFLINKKRFEVQKTKCIMSYIRWIE